MTDDRAASFGLLSAARDILHAIREGKNVSRDSDVFKTLQRAVLGAGVPHVLVCGAYPDGSARTETVLMLGKPGIPLDLVEARQIISELPGTVRNSLLASAEIVAVDERGTRTRLFKETAGKSVSAA